MIFRIAFMSQLRNIFALIISHFYGILNRNWDFRSFFEAFQEMPDVTRGGLHLSNIPSLTLNTNASMPLLGLGVYKATAPGEVERYHATALDLGYRLIDTVLLIKRRGCRAGDPFFFCSTERTLSQQNYGIPHSESEILTGPFNVVWIGLGLIMWIFI